MMMMVRGKIDMNMDIASLFFSRELREGEKEDYFLFSCFLFCWVEGKKKEGGGGGSRIDSNSSRSNYLFISFSFAFLSILE